MNKKRINLLFKILEEQFVLIRQELGISIFEEIVTASLEILN